MDDWQERLTKTIIGAHTKAHVWGKHDCCLFASDCVEAITGHDPATPFFRGTYSDEAGAYRRIREFTEGGGVPELLEQTAISNGWQETPIGKVPPGSLIEFRGFDDSSPIPGICPDGARFVVTAPAGLIRLSLLDHAQRAWVIR